jgi:DNA polymerase III epsilon subunit-like protein
MSKTPEIYISVDVEAAGPIPSEFSMLSIGACVVDEPTKTFYAELQPINDKFIPEALKVSHLDFEQLKKNGLKPKDAMSRFSDWVGGVSGDLRPVFVGFNACFDWAFINWYFHKFLDKNPFGISGLDVKAFYMGLAGVTWDETRSSQLPDKFKSAVKHSHNALDDAREQAEIFRKLLLASRECSRH